MLIGRPLSAFRYIRTHGWKIFLEQVHHRIATRRGERMFGVSTEGYHANTELGLPSPDSNDYAALGYEYIFPALSAIPFPPGDVVFFDYGAGKGRPMVCAASRPFRKVLGVELSPQLASLARENLAAMRHRKVQHAEVIEGDAATYPLPDDVNVVFLFNPFVGEILRAAVARLLESYLRRPRDLFVIAFNHGEFDRLAAGESWLRKIDEDEFRAFYRAKPL
ncbi:MAG: class I SAM-dependent methyltransferase [Bryobacteraceae bacterium]